jgi:hypothetical protein
MKKLLLIFSLFLTQTSYGEYREITIKQLKENGQSYLNQFVKVECTSFETSLNHFIVNRSGDPIPDGLKKNNPNYVDDGKPNIMEEEFLTIVDNYDDYDNCYLYGINKREFLDKYLTGDLIMYGKIVDLGYGYGGKVGFKITKVEKQISYRNTFGQFPLWVWSFLGIFVGVLIYILLVRYGYIKEKE